MKELKEKLEAFKSSTCDGVGADIYLSHAELEHLLFSMGDGWVKVSDKKTPDKEGEYIVYLHQDGICSVVPGYWHPKYGWSIGKLGFDPTIYITHWRNPYSAPTP